MRPSKIISGFLFACFFTGQTGFVRAYAQVSSDDLKTWNLDKPPVDNSGWQKIDGVVEPALGDLVRSLSGEIGDGAKEAIVIGSLASAREAFHKTRHDEMTELLQIDGGLAIGLVAIFLLQKWLFKDSQFQKGSLKSKDAHYYQMKNNWPEAWTHIVESERSAKLDAVVANPEQLFDVEVNSAFRVAFEEEQMRVKKLESFRAYLTDRFGAEAAKVLIAEAERFLKRNTLRAEHLAGTQYEDLFTAIAEGREISGRAAETYMREALRPRLSDKQAPADKYANSKLWTKQQEKNWAAARKEAAIIYQEARKLEYEDDEAHAFSRGTVADDLRIFRSWLRYQRDTQPWLVNRAMNSAISSLNTVPENSSRWSLLKKPWQVFPRAFEAVRSTAKNAKSVFETIDPGSRFTGVPPLDNCNSALASISAKAMVRTALNGAALSVLFMKIFRDLNSQSSDKSPEDLFKDHLEQKKQKLPGFIESQTKSQLLLRAKQIASLKEEIETKLAILNADRKSQNLPAIEYVMGPETTDELDPEDGDFVSHVYILFKLQEPSSGRDLAGRESRARSGILVRLQQVHSDEEDVAMKHRLNLPSERNIPKTVSWKYDRAIQLNLLSQNVQKTLGFEEALFSETEPNIKVDPKQAALLFASTTLWK